jgi:hypothetical protein
LSASLAQARTESICPVSIFGKEQTMANKEQGKNKEKKKKKKEKPALPKK